MRTLVVPAGDRPKPLEVMEKTLDAVSTPVQLAVETATVSLTSGVAADDDLHAAPSDGLRERIRIVARVADDGASLSMRDQLVGGGHVVAIPRPQRDVERAALAVGDDIELRRETSSTTTQTVAEDPPFPPAAS